MKTTFTISTIIMSVFMNLTAVAQVPIWQWANATSGDSQVKFEVISDNNGNAVVSGHYTGIMNIGGTVVSTHANTYPSPLPFLHFDLYIAKYDNTGNLLWVVYPSGVGPNSYSQIFDLEVDASGNIYAWLNLSPWAPGSGVIFGTDTIYTQTTLIKFDPSGNVMWHVDFAREEQSRISVDNAGNIFVRGTLNGGELTRTYDTVTVTNAHPVGLYEAFIVKFNSSGSALWAKVIGGSNEESIISAHFDNADNLYIGGSFTSDTIFFDSGTYLVNTAPAVFQPSDYFYAKLDNNGGVIWAKSIPFASIGGTNSPNFTFNVSPAGEFYMAGTHADTAFTIGTTNFPNPGVFAAKMDINGDLVWVTGVGTGNGIFHRDCQLDGSGNLYILGSFVSDSIIVAGNTFYNDAPGTFTGDAYVAMVNGGGGLLGSFKQGGDNEEDPAFYVNTDGSMYFSLTSSSNSQTFGSITLTNANFPSNHVYLTYTDPFITGIQTPDSESAFSIYPNPASSQLHISFNQTKGNKSKAQIINALGEVVYTGLLSDIQGSVIDISSLASGVYALTVQANTSGQTVKFIKQ